MKKAIKIIGILFLAILVALFLAPILLEDKIIEKVKTEINTNLNAEVDFADADLSFFKSFPFPSISLSDFEIKGNAPFEDINLLKADNIFLQVGLASIIHSDEPIELTKIVINKAQFHIKTLVSGETNTDIFPEAAASNEEPYTLDIQAYEIKDGSLKYEDLQGLTFAEIETINHKGTGDFAKNIFDLKTNTQLSGVNLKSGNVRLAKNLIIKNDMPLSVNTNNNSYSFSNGVFEINDFKLVADGTVALQGDDIAMDIKSVGNNNSVKEFLSLIPYAYTKDFSQVKADGTFTYNAELKGNYNATKNQTPAFDIDLDLQNAKVQYPDLSLPIENINVIVKAKNTSGNINKTDIEIRPIEFTIDGESLRASLLNNNSGTSYFEFDLDTDMDVSKIQKAYPLPGVETLTGQMDVSIYSKGNPDDLMNNSLTKLQSNGKIKFSDLQYKSIGGDPIFVKEFIGDYDKDKLDISSLLVELEPNDITLSGHVSNILNYYFNNENLEGDLTVSSTFMDLNSYIIEGDTSSSQAMVETFDNLNVGINYSADELIYDAYEISNFITKSSLSNDNINIKSAAGKIGESDFSLNGKLTNLYNYLYSNESIEGDLSLDSKTINYADFVEVDPNSATEEIPIIPNNVNVSIQVNADKILYDLITINNAKMNLDVIANRVNMSDFKGNTFGGEIGLQGYYDTENADAPQFGLKYQMDKMNIGKAIESNKTFAILAPIYKYVEGFFNSTLVMEGLLQKDMMPDFNSLTGSGFVETLEGKLLGYSPVEKINSLLNLESGKQWFLKGTKNWFEIKNGALQVKEFGYQVKDIPMKISGNHRFNMDMNYLIKASIPRKYVETTGLGKEITKEFDEIISQINKRGLDIQSGSYVDADIVLTGNIKNPQIKLTNIRIADKPLTEQIKDQVRQKVDEKKAEIRDTVLTKVNETVNTIRDTVNTKTQEIKDTLITKANEMIDSTKEKAKDIVFSQIDTLLKEKLPDSTLTIFKDKVGGILKENTEISVDSILNKIKNPFKIKKLRGGNQF